MNKLEKIGADLDKARKRLASWDKKVKELEARYQEEENTMINDIVHAAKLTPEELSQILALAAKGKVGVYPEGMIEKEEEDEKEDE